MTIFDYSTKSAKFQANSTINLNTFILFYHFQYTKLTNKNYQNIIIHNLEGKIIMISKVSNIFLGNTYIAKLDPLSLTHSQEEIENDKIFYRPLTKH